MSHTFRLPDIPDRSVSENGPKDRPDRPTDRSGEDLASIPATSTYGRRGIVASPHHLASDAGLRILRRGGSAVDAALTANLVLSVVYPDMCGVGGDLFALVWEPGDRTPTVLNASGTAGSGRDLSSLRRRHPSGLPLHGAETITIPGAPAGWGDLHQHFGHAPFGDLFSDAIFYAMEGFPCPRRLAASLERVDIQIPDLLPAGRPPKTGQTVRLRSYGKTLTAIADDGPSVVYEGPIADEFVAGSEGLITRSDLRGYRTHWAEPLRRQVWGLDLWTVPPNSQGYVALLAAAILERLGPPTDPEDPRQWHLMIEAVKAAGHDRDEVLGDPLAGVPRAFDDVEHRASGIGPEAAAIGTFAEAGDTVFVCAVDAAGRGCSLIQSLYHPWGARVYLPRSGVLAQNRGASFSLDDAHPNAFGPGRRPRSTLSPTLLTEAGSLYGLLGTMGGDVQPQVILQNLVRHRLSGLDPAETLAFPRFYIHRGLAPSIWSGPAPVVGIEARTPVTVQSELRSRGHPVRTGARFSEGAGHAQFVLVTDDGLVGSADPRAGAASAAAW